MHPKLKDLFRQGLLKVLNCVKSIIDTQNQKCHHKIVFRFRLQFISEPKAMLALQLGFYLGYLRGRSFPPPKKKECPASPKKILSSLQYISNYIRKIIQTRQGRCTHCNISQNCVSKCTCISAHIHFKTFPGGMHLDPPRKLVAFSHSGRLPQRINPR